MHFDKIYKKNLEKEYFQDKPQEDMPKLVKLLKKNKMTKVLDHGCGSGRNTVYFAKQGFDVSAFDISKVGLDKTRKWLKKEKVEAKLKLHDIFKKLPYEDESFDAVVSIRAIEHNYKDPIKKAIKDIYRVLRPGGYFFLQTGREDDY